VLEVKSSEYDLFGALEDPMIPWRAEKLAQMIY
jgi:hypothetical protein